MKTIEKGEGSQINYANISTPMNKRGNRMVTEPEVIITL